MTLYLFESHIQVYIENEGMKLILMKFQLEQYGNY